MKRKIFRNIFVLSLLCIVVTSLLVTIFNYWVLLENTKKGVRNEAAYIRQMAADEYTRVNEAASRITILAPDGRVVYDNRADAATMENHSDRPEFKSALTNGFGESLRKSETFGNDGFYYAVSRPDGYIARVAAPAPGILSVFSAEIPMLLLIIAVVFPISVFAARWQSKKITEPINRLNLEEPLECDYDELAPLLSRIKQQQDEIVKQKKKFERQRDEFRAVTENMSEGLMILNRDGIVLSSNASILEIFKLNDIDGTHYLSVCREPLFKNIVETALAGGKADEFLTISGRDYSAVANPVYSRGVLKGATLLIFDCTEKRQNERLRREFTANVSHELKTPLTSISGYAEIIETGIAKPDDVSAFCKKIHKEAIRMLSLIEDILRLSKLDEKAEPICKRETDLDVLCRDLCDRLRQKAGRFDISICENYGGVKAVTSPEILEEMVYNLCDNAIKYGKKGGYVKISTTYDGERAQICVEDNGIGIPGKYQARIFERFFRVDKSRSKQTGGTGLGLAIVKHAADAIGADVDFHSVEGEGTTFLIKL